MISTPEFSRKAQQARNPHLAIEALRKSLTEESAVGHARQPRASASVLERIAELMNKYTNQQLTSAEVIAELVELAKEVAAEASRGSHFSPPLNDDELAFYDAVAQNESAVEVQGEGVLAEIARELVAVMRRDVRTDWTVRDDVRAKLRSSIKRLLVKSRVPAGQAARGDQARDGADGVDGAAVRGGAAALSRGATPPACPRSLSR